MNEDKPAHVRLCHSRILFVRAYPRETLEMVLDARDRAFAFFKGTCTRGIHDNMKTAVDAVFVGKDRYTIAAFRRCAATVLSSRSPARKRSAKAPVRPMSSSTSLHAAVISGDRLPWPRRIPLSCATNRRPIAADITA